MPKFKIIISIVILIASLFLLFNRLFTPQPIQITLQSGQEITTSTPEYFSLSEVLLVAICAFLIGSTSIYLFYNSDGMTSKKESPQRADADVYSAILPLLKPDEKHAINALRDSKGEMQQNKLAAKLGLSKVKATRLLHSLQQKGLITKERSGFTNLVRLKK